MRAYTANDLQFKADILDGGKAREPVATGLWCGIEDLAGRALEVAQLQAAATTHRILFRGDTPVKSSSYIQAEGTLYLVDYLRDPRDPRPGAWLEVYCHAERRG